jgi:hypothetical protein
MKTLRRYIKISLIGLMLVFVTVPLQSCKRDPGSQRYKGKMKPGKSPCPVKDC